MLADITSVSRDIGSFVQSRVRIPVSNSDSNVNCKKDALTNRLLTNIINPLERYNRMWKCLLSREIRGNINKWCNLYCFVVHTINLA